MVAMTVNNMSIKYLDVLEFVKGSQKIKDSGELAEYQGKQIEAAIETAVQYVRSERQNLAEKKDIDDAKNELRNEIKESCFQLRNEIKELRAEAKYYCQKLRYDTLKFVVWSWISGVVTLGGMMAHGFHWF